MHAHVYYPALEHVRMTFILRYKIRKDIKLAIGPRLTRRGEMSSLESCWFPVENIILLLLLLNKSSVGLQSDKFVVQPHPVQFNEEPHNWTVTEGASINLTCNTTVVQVIGYIDEDTTPLPQIRWFHNDEMINSTGHFAISNYGIDTSILTIRNVTSLEQGEYYCVVNEWVKPDGDWWIKTRSKSGFMRVIISNSTLTLNIKENVVLFCLEPTTEVPQSGVVWIKDGVKMSENVTVVMFEVKDNTTNGDYRCINLVNNITLFHCIVVTVIRSYLQQELLMLNMNIENHFIKVSHMGENDGCNASPANQSVTMKCMKSDHMSVTWYKNGEVLDLSSEGTMYNRMSGELVIRREDACELLGIYQCFASNDIDTVHVSTRVLPLGWLNPPGKPKLIKFEHKIIKFELKIKVHPPDYLAGFAIEELSYHVFLANSGRSKKVMFQQTVNSSIASEGVNVQLKKEFINDLDVIQSIYWLMVSISYTNKTLSDYIALSEPSPRLKIDVICTFTKNPPNPKIMGTCVYDNSSDLVTHNISWYVPSVFEGFSNKFHSDEYKVIGGCTYPNGTIAGMNFTGHRLLKEYHTQQLPNNSICILSVSYETICGSATSNLTTDYCTDDNNGIDMLSKFEGNNDTPVAATTSLSVVLVVIISVSTFLMYFCYRKYSHRKQSALRMLNNVEEINRLQATCPIGIDQESAYGPATKSEMYIEKVSRWMEYISEADLDSVLEGCSLGTSEMLDQIVEGKTPKTAQLTLDDYVQDKLVESCDKISSLRRCSIKKRLQSADSGLECDGNTPSTVASGNLFQKYCQAVTNGMAIDSPAVADCDKLDESSNEPLHCDNLQETSYHSDNHKVVDHLLSKSANKFNSNGLKIIDQEKCLPNSTDYVVIDQEKRLPKSTEKFEYIGLEVIDQDYCLPRSPEKFDYFGLEITDQDQCSPRSIENFDYLGLELADQDHCCLSLSTEKINESNTEAKSKCVQKSTQNLSYCAVVESDGNYSMLKSTEKIGNFELEVIDHQDHNTCKSMKTLVDSFSFNEDNQPSLTGNINDQYCTCCAYMPAENPDCCYNGSNLQDQTCCQSSNKEVPSSHEAKANDKTLHDNKDHLQFNSDGYVTNPVLTGQYCI